MSSKACTMKNSYQFHSFQVGILPFLFVPFFILSSSADPTFENFSKCMIKNGVPSNEISKILFNPTNPSFTTVLNAYVRNERYNTSSTKKPSIIVTPLLIPQVQATVICTKETTLLLKVRSGGHDYEGISYWSKNAFLLLDMFNLRSITVDLPTKTSWVQVGATLGEVYHSIWKKSNVLGYPAGVCPTVGVGGHLSGGGYGTLMRKYGLAVDNIVDAQIIDVNGKSLDRKGMGEDLFWAIRGGGGGSFGVVLAYKINLVAVPPIVTVFSVSRDKNPEDLIVKWQSIMAKIDNNLFIRILVQPVPLSGKTIIRLTFMALYLGGSNTVLTLLKSQFPELGLLKTDCKEMSWIQAVVWWATFKNPAATPEALLNRTPDSVNFLKRKSDYVVAPIPKAALISVFNKVTQIGKVGLVFNHHGGKVNEVPETETPYPHRSGILYMVQYSVSWSSPDPKITTENLDAAKELYSFMTPHVSSNPRQAFLNYRDLDIGITDHGKNSYNEGKVYGLKYFKNNFDRLVKVKTAVDPKNFFRNEQSIPVLPGKVV